MLLWIVLGVAALTAVVIVAVLTGGRAPDHTEAGKGEFTASGCFP